LAAETVLEFEIFESGDNALKLHAHLVCITRIFQLCHIMRKEI